MMQILNGQRGFSYFTSFTKTNVSIHLSRALIFHFSKNISKNAFFEALRIKLINLNLFNYYDELEIDIGKNLLNIGKKMNQFCPKLSSITSQLIQATTTSYMLPKNI